SVLQGVLWVSREDRHRRPQSSKTNVRSGRRADQTTLQRLGYSRHPRRQLQTGALSNLDDRVTVTRRARQVLSKAHHKLDGSSKRKGLDNKRLDTDGGRIQ